MAIVTKVTLPKGFAKQLTKVPTYIQYKVRDWILQVETFGIRETARLPGLHDEPLLGKRWGQRSVRLNRSYRLVYRVLQEQVHIEVLEVHKHEY